MKPLISIVFFVALGIVAATSMGAAAEPRQSAGPLAAAAASDPASPTRMLSQSAQAAAASYTVQVGSFRERANAEAALAQLVAEYDDGFIVEVTQSDATMFRVVSGRFDAMEDALTREQALKLHGFATYVRRMVIPSGGAKISLLPREGRRLLAW